MIPITEKTCIICGRLAEDGLTLLGQFICAACEKEIATLDVGDGRYEDIQRKLKKIWVKKTGKEEIRKKSGIIYNGI